MESLSKLFGTRSRVKIIRLFLLNQDKLFTAKAVAKAAGVSEAETLSVLRSIEHAGLVKKKVIREPKGLVARKGLRRAVWSLDRSYVYLIPLQNLLVNTALLHSADLVGRLARAGNIKLIAISGVFLQRFDSRVDLLVVADRIRRAPFERVMRVMEVETGKELRYSLLETNDFVFRQSIGDRLIRDIFDFPHQVLLDKIGLK